MALVLQGLCPLLQVYDMPTSVWFYTEVLGFDVSSRSETYAIGEDGSELFHWCLLRREGIELMLNTAYDAGERPSEPDAARLLAHRDTGLFFGCPDVDAAYADLVRRAIPCAPPRTAWYGMRQLSLRDPDGYEITLQTQTVPAEPLL